MHRKIFAMGDSHSRRCFESHAHIADSTVAFGHNKLDGKTAFNLSRHEKKVKKIGRALLGRDIISVFGEVDVRIHIKYKAEQFGVSAGQLIDTTADRYTGYVQDLRKQGHRLHVFNVVPTGDFSCEEARKWERGLGYPFTASLAERTDYTLQMNDCYRFYCVQRSIPFIDIYDHLVDEKGIRKKELVYDFSHLNSRCADLVLEHYRFH